MSAEEGMLSLLATASRAVDTVGLHRRMGSGVVIRRGWMVVTIIVSRLSRKPQRLTGIQLGSPYLHSCMPVEGWS